MSGLVLAFLALVTSTPDRSECTSIPGAAALLSNPLVKTVLVGEVHGTNEAPAAFADLVCLAGSSGRKVVVALEHPTAEQGAIDRFVASDGGPVAIQHLTAAAEWHSDLQDGRTSAAHLALLQDLRVLVAQKHIARVIAIMPTLRSSDAEYEKEMSANVSKAGSANELVLVLVGNVHAMLVPWKGNAGTSYLPMAANLPRASTRSLNATGNGGSAWVCMPTCGSHEFSAPPKSYPRGIKLIEGDGKPYDGFFNLGVPTTASLPAVPK